MVKVSIADVIDGMIADEDVNAPNGSLLVARGQTLGEAHIRSMRAFGVHTVAIVSDAPPPDADEENQRRVEAACRERLEPRFAALDRTTAFGKTVWELAVARAARYQLHAPASAAAPAPTPLLTSPPPEQALFAQQAFDPADLVSGKVELATLPEVHGRLMQALNAPTSTPASIAAVVGHDPSLSAKLLRLVNSPFYGATSPIDTISRAVAMVGQKELTNLVLGLAACNAFTDIPPDLWDMRSFWQHAASCGVYATTLAESCPGTSPDRVFVGGLLHDIGQLVILRKIPAAAGRALLLARIEGMLLREAERAVLGFDHDAVSKALLTRWNFPESLVAMVADHDHPSGRPEDRETAVIHVADILATALAPAGPDGPLVTPLDSAAWRSLDITEAILPMVAETGDARIKEIETVFFETPAPKRRR